MARLKSEAAPAIALRGLTVTFPGRRTVLAVDDVSFDVAHRESFGIVGESGSGKSTVLRTVAGLVEPAAGSISIGGVPVGRRRTKGERRLLQLVFQDPYGSLHPRHTVDATLREPLAIHGEPRANERIAAALADVGLAPALRYRFPHQLSGGQRQRVALARALILDPSILLLDEPTSALDVSVQAEILNLLSGLRAARHLTTVLVSHDLAVVAHLCDRLAVMREGRIVEILAAGDLRRGAVRQDYTRALLAASRGFQRQAL